MNIVKLIKNNKDAVLVILVVALFTVVLILKN